jgi:hypothetical protein
MTSSLETHVVPAGMPPLLPPFSRLCGACGSFLNPSGVLACADSGAFLTINNTSLFSTGADDKLVSSATNRPRHKMRCSDGFTPDLVSTSFFKARIFVCSRAKKRVSQKVNFFCGFATFSEKKKKEKVQQNASLCVGGRTWEAIRIDLRARQAIAREKRETRERERETAERRRRCVFFRGNGSRSQSYGARYPPGREEMENLSKRYDRRALGKSQSRVIFRSRAKRERESDETSQKKT